ncbi:MAG: SDR family NAD(P)-dependent oxidoreductase [Thermoleophilia bacterium]
MNIAGSCILVVGGARRLGRLLALDLAARGADVAISSRSGGDAAIATCAAITAYGRRAVAVTGELAAPDAAAAIVDQAAAELGRLDALVYAASGPFAPQRPEAIDQATWDASFNTIARGFFFAATAAYRHFTNLQPVTGEPVSHGEQTTRATATSASTARTVSADAAFAGGVIVALTDTLGVRPSAVFAAHAAAKAAQIMLVQTLAKAWGPQGVRVCGVAPGPVDLPDEPRRAALDRAAQRTVLGRMAQPDDIAAAIRFCLENEYTTGHNLAVDGGTLLV